MHRPKTTWLQFRLVSIQTSLFFRIVLNFYYVLPFCHFLWSARAKVGFFTKITTKFVISVSILCNIILRARQKNKFKCQHPKFRIVIISFLCRYKIFIQFIRSITELHWNFNFCSSFFQMLLNPKWSMWDFVKFVKKNVGWINNKRETNLQKDQLILNWYCIQNEGKTVQHANESGKMKLSKRIEKLRKKKAESILTVKQWCEH